MYKLLTEADTFVRAATGSQAALIAALLVACCCIVRGCMLLHFQSCMLLHCQSCLVRLKVLEKSAQRGWSLKSVMTLHIATHILYE